MLDLAGRDAWRLLGELGVVDEDSVDVVESADDVVEADAGQANPGFVLAAGIGDQDDCLAGSQDVAGVFGESPVEPDVDRTTEVARCEELRGSTVDHDGTLGLLAEREVDVERRGVAVVVEELAVASVGVGGEGEVERCDRLPLGNGFHECVLAHRGERVVGASLFADRGLAGR